VGGIYEVCYWDGFMCNIKFHEDWFRYQKLIRRDTQTHREDGNRISLLLYSQNKESKLKALILYS
jgi:hypothetical protein